MRRGAQGAVLVLLGGVVLRVALTDLHLRYVRPYMGPFLVVSGVVLMLLGLGALVGGARSTPDSHPEGAHEHEHGRWTARAAWLMVLPVLALLVTPPSALGSFAAGRLSTRVSPPSAAFTALRDPVDGATTVAVVDYVRRAVYGRETVQGMPVRLRGFVVRESAGWSVAVLVVSCCAADARPAKVRVIGAEAPRDDTWVEVVGTLDGVDGDPSDTVVSLHADSVSPIVEPRSPYVYG